MFRFISHEDQLICEVFSNGRFNATCANVRNMSPTRAVAKTQLKHDYLRSFRTVNTWKQMERTKWQKTLKNAREGSKYSPFTPKMTDNGSPDLTIRNKS
jgi:hypothetical protein